MFNIQLLPLELEEQLHPCAPTNMVVHNRLVPVNRLIVTCDKKFFINKTKVVWCIWYSELESYGFSNKELHMLIPILKYTNPVTCELSKSIKFLSKKSQFSFFKLRRFFSKLEIIGFISKIDTGYLIHSSLALPYLSNKNFKSRILQLPLPYSNNRFSFIPDNVQSFMSQVHLAKFNYLELKILVFLLTKLNFESFTFLHKPSICEYLGITLDEFNTVLSKLISYKLLIDYNNMYKLSFNER